MTYSQWAMSPEGLRFALLALASIALLQCGDPSLSPDRSKQSARNSPLAPAPELIPPPEDVEPTPLIGEFESLISLEEAIARSNGLPYETIANETRLRRGTCPGQHHLDLKITRYWDLGSRGTLILSFYDDKLTRAWFMTGDHEGYRERYFAKHGTERVNRWKPIYIRPATRIMTSLMGNQGIVARDARMWGHVDSVDRACNHQTKFERGQRLDNEGEREATS